jgi:hypothetical protein
MSSISNLSSEQFRQAAILKEEIELLEKELSQLMGSTAKPPAKPAMKSTPKKKSKRSAAVRARMAASAKARWAKVKAAGK